MTTKTILSRRNLLRAAAAAPLILPALTRTAWAQSGDAPPPLTAYGKLPSLENVALSPDGKRIALVMSQKGERIIVDYDLATGKTSAGAIQGDKIRHLMWADNESILVVTGSTQKSAGDLVEYSFGSLMNLPKAKRSVLYSNVAGGSRETITGDFNRITAKNGYRVTAASYKAPDGINMTETNSSNALTDTWERCLYAFSSNSLLALRIDSDSRPIENWAIRSDGSLTGRSEFDDETKTWTLRYRDSKGWKEIYSLKTRYDRPWLAGLGRDGNSLLIYFTSGEHAGKYVEFDSAGTTTVLDIDGQVHSPVFHPATNLLAGFQNNGPVDSWTFYDPVMQRLPKLIEQALPESFNDIMAMAENPRQLVVLSETAEDPGTYFYFDFTKGDVKEIGRAYPDIPPEWIAARTYITYAAADGLEIGAWLTLPRNRDPKNLALVVMPHGGPEAMDDWRFEWMSQALASRGYAVLQPNYRGSSGYGTAFTEKGYGEFGRKMQTDLSDGVTHLVKQGMVDPGKVAIAGASYGGYAALAGISLQQGIYNCAVSISGLSDLKAFLAYRRERSGFDGKSYSVEYWRRFIGGDDQLESLSPINHVASIAVPVLLIHGKDDTVVPFSQSDRMYDALRKAGRQAELSLMKGEDHYLSREATRVETLDAMVGFLLRHNPPA